MIVIAALAVTAAVAVTGFVLISRGDSPYETNQRAVQELGTPSGFTPTSERDIGAGRLRKTFTSTSCSGPCSPQQWDAGIKAVRAWLQALQDVLMVSPPQPAACSPQCLIQVDSRRKPPISKVEIRRATNGQHQLQIEIG